MKKKNSVAIIGISGRFPGAQDPSKFWEMLSKGSTGTTRFSADELKHAGVPETLVNDEKYVPVRGVIGNEEYFDGKFFGFTAHECELMDPQARHFLECAWHALEDAGYGSSSDRLPISLYACSSRSEYEHHLIKNLDDEMLAAPFALDGTLSDFIPLRTSHKLNLQGPSLLVKTACSSSLVAVHLACKSIASGESQMALVGATAISWPAVSGRTAHDGGIISKSGVCRPFDADADGTVSSDAVAFIVLKNLEAALADGDSIYAVIRGSAVNNDGAAKPSFTSPSIDGQIGAIRAALKDAEVSPREIGYIEMHGSGTAIGDPLELEAVSEAYDLHAEAGERVFIGSVKGNVGHTDTAAGIVGLIKVALCLHHGQIVSNPNFANANRDLSLEESGFFVAKKKMEWTERTVAAVHSIGMGGTNAHCILEKAPSSKRRERENARAEVIVLSATSATALEEAGANLLDWICDNQEHSFADMCHTLRVGREEFGWRRAFVANGFADAKEKLWSRNPGDVYANAGNSTQSDVAFLVPGLGTFNFSCINDLRKGSPAFSKLLKANFDTVYELLQLDLAPFIDSAMESAQNPFAFGTNSGAPSLPTIYAQPLMFSVTLALADLWRQIGIAPKAILGYSLGEIVAATIAGVFSRTDAFELVCRRAELINQAETGFMVTVCASASDCESLLVSGVEIAGINAENLTVLSGPDSKKAEQVQRLLDGGKIHRFLPTQHPFHTTYLENASMQLEKLLDKFQKKSPKCKIMSTVTGNWLTESEATSSTYWAKQICLPILGQEALSSLLQKNKYCLVELGSTRFLSDLALLHSGESQLMSFSSFEGNSNNGYEQWLGTVAQLWTVGKKIRWTELSEGKGAARIKLPVYPFERTKHIVEARPRAAYVANPGPPNLLHASGLAGGLVEERARPVSRNDTPVEAADPEDVMHKIWAKAFGNRNIPRFASFYQIGGHSLLAVQLIFYIKSTFKVQIGMADLKNFPTIELLTRHVMKLAGKESLEIH